MLRFFKIQTEDSSISISSNNCSSILGSNNSTSSSSSNYHHFVVVSKCVDCSSISISISIDITTTINNNSIVNIIMSMKRKDRSIKLADYAADDGDGDVDGDDMDELGMFMKAAQANRTRNVWGDDRDKADKAKARVEGKLFKYFSRLTVEINDDNDDSHNNNHIDQDIDRGNRQAVSLAKGLDALDCLQKIQGIFKKFKDDVHKEIFISVAKSNKIVKLKELLELCAKQEKDYNAQDIDYTCIDEDRDLAYQCCHIILSFFEIKNRVLRKVLSTNVRTTTKGKETKDEAKSRCENEIATRANAIDQLAVLVQSKDLFCSEKCAKAISAVYKEGWLASIDDIEAVNVRRERREYNDEIKKKIKTCLVFLRRLLEVDTVNTVSSQMDILKTRVAHCKLVTNFEIMLNSVPAICCDLMMYNELTDNLKPNVYHDDWLVDVIYIIAALFRGHSVKDMYRSWKEGFSKKDRALLKTKTQTPSPAPTSSNASMDVLMKNKLKELVKKDADKRNSLMSNARNGRSSATYKINRAPVQLTEEEMIKNEADNPDDNKHKRVQAVSAIIVSKLSTSDTIGNVQNKRNKKSLTFAPTTSRVPESYAQDPDGPTACAVMASIMDKLCSSGGLNRLAARVNKGKINDDGLIITDIDRGIDAELIYFQVLSTLLQFNRLKLEDEKRQFEKHQVTSPEGWEPDLSNVFYVLESITWRSALDCMDQLHQKKHYQEEYIPMMVYKELICYLRLMLESSSEAHHEVAVSIMHRLFYVSSERQDPLPQLVRNWSPGVYDRKHLNCLVEIVHETMKTLEVAQSRFESKRNEVSKRKKGLDLDQKILACLRSKPEDYFKRLVNNESVRMYTKLLSKYESNEISINHYVYCFMQRVCNYKLEQEYKTKAANSDGVEEEVGLGHLLFNIQTLTVFSQILNDSKVEKQKEMQPILRLIRHVTRRFGDASKKNHMLFVEALFQHSRAHEFVLLIDSVYEAPMYVSMAQNKNEREQEDREFIADDDKPVEVGNDEYGDEFEDDMFRSVKKKKREKRSKERTKGRRERKPKRKPWTEDEDDIIREQYDIYKGSRSMFDMIMNDPKLIALGNDRSSRDIEKRIVQLKLNIEGIRNDNDNDNDDNDSDDNDNDDNDYDSDNNNDKNIALSDSENEGSNNMKSNVSSASKESVAARDDNNNSSSSNIDSILDIEMDKDPDSFESRLRENWEQVSDDDDLPRKRTSNEKLSKKKKLQKRSSKMDDADDSDVDGIDDNIVDRVENKENMPVKKRQIVIDSDDDL